MSEPRKTPLYKKHHHLKAKMIDFHGWLMPVEYSGIIPEAEGTRQNAGLFDVSHMGKIMVEGKTAKTFLQGILTNDLDKLSPGQAACGLLCYYDGGVIDDLLVYCLEEESFLLIVNACNTTEDLKWFRDRQLKGATVRDITMEYAILALQGPFSQAIMEELAPVQLSELRSFRFMEEVKVAGIDCLVSRTGYTGEDGFEIFCSPGDAPSLWDALCEAGSKEKRGLVPAGLGARGLLRLEASMPLYNHEISREITPLEAGLHRFVALDKEVPFIGQDALQKQQREGLQRKLAGLEMLQRGVPREGYTVEFEGKEIGWVSSGTYSPALQKPIAMAFLPPEKAVSGTEVEVIIRGRKYPCRVVKTPFYRRR